MSNNGYTGSTVLFALLAGAATGAAVALLTAPKSGRETREDLRQLGSTVVRTAGQVPAALRAAYDTASSAALDAFNANLLASANTTERS